MKSMTHYLHIASMSGAKPGGLTVMSDAKGLRHDREGHK